MARTLSSCRAARYLLTLLLALKRLSVSEFFERTLPQLEMLEEKWVPQLLGKLRNSVCIQFGGRV